MPPSNSSAVKFIRKIGILGGGQLARMLALKGAEMGLEVHILSGSRQDPAAQVTGFHHQGDVASSDHVKSFLQHVQVATFESEFMDADLLARVSRDTKTPIYPKPELMGQLQDRLVQKQLLLDSGLPTSPFFKVDSLADAQHAARELGQALVLKKRRFGYDGYGTFVVKTARDLEGLESVIAEEKTGFIAEKFIPFQREVALMIARRAGGETLRLPWVETFQQNSRCLWVKGIELKSRAKKSKARKSSGKQSPTGELSAEVVSSRLVKMLAKLDYRGIMGVEFFQTSRGLLVNELAPRVHNSGHYSLDALSEDQFTLHLKGILDLPFAKLALHAPGFAMLNLLGTHSREVSWRLPADVHLHWYGKHENREGRKMGHLNSIGTTSTVALKNLLAARKHFDV